MSIKARLEEDMKNAMRERESGKFRLSVIRMVRASIKNAEINERRELNDDEVLGVLAKEMKMRRDSYEEFTKAGRADLAEAAQRETEILAAYMPAQLTSEEVRAQVLAVIQETGATGPKDMGKVMSALTPKTKGRADGKEVSVIVKELLASLG